MTRYIDADALIRLIEIDALCNGGHFSKRDVIGCVKASPTIDVVPRAEVEALLKENERWMTEYAGFRAGVKSIIEKSNQEVAREIFDEIDKRLDKITIVATRETEYSAFITTIQQVFDAVGVVVSELKKKYTEEKE